MLLIKNGYMIDPKNHQEGTKDILIDGARIIKIEEPGKIELQNSGGIDEILDAEGCVVAPGLIDVHVHFRDPGLTYKEDIMTGSKAAAKGGFTTVVLMANTKPIVDNADTLQYVLEKGKETGIHVESCCSITENFEGKKLTDMSELLSKGAAGFTDDGIPILDKEMTRKAMQKAKELDVVLSFHEENPAYIVNNGVNAGKASEHFGIGGSNRQAEISMIARDLELAEETEARINIQHISTREGVELVRNAKAKGLDVHAEATPHHFTLTEEATIIHGTYAKMNPPLREEADRKAIIEGLKDGTIDLIATDHAPHSSEEKAKAITEAPSGIIGLETALSLGITSLVEKGELTMMELLEKMTINPATLYKLDCGYLAENGPADLVIFDPKKEYIVGEFASKSENSPFKGEKLVGQVITTICDGKIVYRQK